MRATKRMALRRRVRPARGEEAGGGDGGPALGPPLATEGSAAATAAAAAAAAAVGHGGAATAAFRRRAAWPEHLLYGGGAGGLAWVDPCIPDQCTLGRIGGYRGRSHLLRPPLSLLLRRRQRTSGSRETAQRGQGGVRLRGR